MKRWLALGSLVGILLVAEGVWHSRFAWGDNPPTATAATETPAPAAEGRKRTLSVSRRNRSLRGR